MRIQGAVVREQGVTFAIAVVKPHVLDNRQEANETAMSLQPVFGPVPIILMAQRGGRARYYGRDDIVRFLSRVPLAAIPWREYTIH